MSESRYTTRPQRIRLAAFVPLVEFLVVGVLLLTAPDLPRSGGHRIAVFEASIFPHLLKGRT